MLCNEVYKMFEITRVQALYELGMNNVGIYNEVHCCLYTDGLTLRFVSAK